ncbi:hypothetical protein PBRA_005969 [Plasmodiophora brassicae]|uniref:Uncharacterized protein n=1 Tax=Plasmodiophora brassicae TaxID=37360 RepID=A0A0G4IRG0_PLABS|nr:hypothetical protein PBRA_005969 [Plasmodiophora brassicae]
MSCNGPGCQPRQHVARPAAGIAENAPAHRSEVDDALPAGVGADDAALYDALAGYDPQSNREEQDWVQAIRQADLVVADSVARLKDARPDAMVVYRYPLQPGDNDDRPADAAFAKTCPAYLDCIRLPVPVPGIAPVLCPNVLFASEDHYRLNAEMLSCPNPRVLLHGNAGVGRSINLCALLVCLIARDRLLGTWADSSGTGASLTRPQWPSSFDTVARIVDLPQIGVHVNLYSLATGAVIKFHARDPNSLPMSVLDRPGVLVLFEQYAYLARNAPVFSRARSITKVPVQSARLEFCRRARPTTFYMPCPPAPQLHAMAHVVRECSSGGMSVLLDPKCIDARIDAFGNIPRYVLTTCAGDDDDNHARRVSAFSRMTGRDLETALAISDDDRAPPEVSDHVRTYVVARSGSRPFQVATTKLANRHVRAQIDERLAFIDDIQRHLPDNDDGFRAMYEQQQR